MRLRTTQAVALAFPLLLALALAACVPVAAPGASPLATPTVMPPMTPTPTESPAAGIPEDQLPAAALNVRQVLGQQLGVPPAQIAVLEAEPVEWTDSCLGAGQPDESCLQVITPGYRIVLEADGARYVYHTNQDGDVSRLVESPPLSRATGGEAPVVEWRLENAGGCEQAAIGADAVMFGPCAGPRVKGVFAMPERAADLAEFAARLAPFNADTPAGSVVFHGAGAGEATPAEQRMIAEWARLVALEAAAGRSGASWGLAFAWNREGGIAGFCDSVTVYVSGDLYVGDCRRSEPRTLLHRRLSAGELAAVYGWVDALAPFEEIQSDAAAGATADAMTTRLVFSGAGERAATAEEKAAIADMAAAALQEAQP